MQRKDYFKLLEEEKNDIVPIPIGISGDYEIIDDERSSGVRGNIAHFRGLIY